MNVTRSKGNPRLIDRTPETCPALSRVTKWCLECRSPYKIATNIAHRYTTCSDECSRARKSRTRMGDKNPLWRGDDATKGKKHQWLRQRYVPTGICDWCGSTGKTDLAFLRHPEPYTRNRDDYSELCRSCHVTFDYQNGQRGRVVAK